MSYVRRIANQQLEPKIVQTLAQLVGLKLSGEEAQAITPLLLSQLAAMKSVERFDLKDAVPILKMDARWHE